MRKFFLALLIPFICCSQPKIGAIYNLTGELAPLGIASSKGAVLAAEENKLSLIVRDGGSDKNKIEKIAKNFASDSKIKFSFGLNDNMMVASALPIFSLTNKKFVSSGATAPNLVLAYPKVLYLVAFGDNTQAAAAAEYAYKTLKQKKAVVLYDNSIEYSISLSSYFIASYVHFGGKISLVKGFAHNAFPDKYLRLIKKTHPKFIYLAAAEADVMPTITKLRKAGINSIIMGGDSYTTSQLKSLGELANNVYFTTHVYLGEDNPNPKVQAFMQAYQKRYHQAPDNAFSALAYDAVNIIAKVINDDDFNSIKNYKGVTGTFNYSHNRHMPLKSVTVISFKDGKPRLKARFIPSYVPKPIRFIMN